MKAVISMSGGLDSTTLAHFVVKELKSEIFPISFYYGQKHKIELEMAKYQVNVLKRYGNVHDLKIVDISFMKGLLGRSTALVSDDVEVPSLDGIRGQEDQPITYVPFRNTILLSICLAYAEANKCDVVYYGAQQRDIYGYWDCTEDFVERMNKVLELNRKNKIRICAPFLKLRKSEIIKVGLNLGVDYSLTWSCYKGGDKACGVCPTCVERLKAFSELGLKDPLEYELIQ